jgi:hypothetical protein
MAFIRAKKHGTREYYYLVESYWIPGKGPHQRVLKYLGKENPKLGVGNEPRKR